MKNKFIINQETLEFNTRALENDGWTTKGSKIEKLNITGLEYQKTVIIQDAKGSHYHIDIWLRQHEHIALIFVNSEWVGRCLYIHEANNIVNAINKNCK